VVYWCNSYTIVHFSLDIIEWFKYKLKKVFKLYWILIHPPLSINIQLGGSIPKDSSVSRSSPGWKDTFSIDDKGGEIYQMQSTKARFQGGVMVIGGE
jgi:hypothetical protein